MYTNQILPDDEAFKTFFQLPEPTQTLTFDWLNSDWYAFQGSTKKRNLKDYYSIFSGYKYEFLKAYNKWQNKYVTLYNYWVEKLACESELPLLEAKLTKPLEKYTLKSGHWDKFKIYSNKKAEAVNVTQRKIEHLTKKIDQTLAISDAPPKVPNELLKSWTNLKYMINQENEYLKLQANLQGVRRQNKVNLGKKINRKGCLVDAPRYHPEAPKWDF